MKDHKLLLEMMLVLNFAKSDRLIWREKPGKAFVADMRAFRNAKDKIENRKAGENKDITVLAEQVRTRHQDQDVNRLLANWKDETINGGFITGLMFYSAIMTGLGGLMTGVMTVPAAMSAETWIRREDPDYWTFGSGSFIVVAGVAVGLMATAVGLMATAIHIDTLVARYQQNVIKEAKQTWNNIVQLANQTKEPITA